MKKLICIAVFIILLVCTFTFMFQYPILAIAGPVAMAVLMGVTSKDSTTFGG